MTKSTDTKNINKMVKGLLIKHGIDNLTLEIDLISAFMRYLHEREDGESPAQARMRVTREVGGLDAILQITQTFRPRAEMRERVERALGRNPNWEDLKQDWNTFDVWLIEREKQDGQTIESFMKWHNADEYRLRGVIYLTPIKIKDWWLQAFSEQTNRVITEYRPSRIKA